MNYIGVDCHISSIDFAVVNERGTTTKRQRVNTGAKELIGFIKSVPKPRKVIIEKEELANLLLETCSHYGEELFFIFGGSPRNYFEFGAEIEICVGEGQEHISSIQPQLSISQKESYTLRSGH